MNLSALLGTFLCAFGLLSACSLPHSSAERIFLPGIPKSVLPWGGTKQLGVAGVDTIASSVAVDSQGNVFFGGYSEGSLPGNTLLGTLDSFVTKYYLWGDRHWLKQFGSPARSGVVFGLTTDSTANVIATGITYGSLDGNPLTGNVDLFVIKYNQSGERQWTQLSGIASADTVAMGVSTDLSGNIFVAGGTTGSLDGQSKTGSQDLFLIKYDAFGVKQWTRLLGGAGGYTLGQSLATDLQGNVYVTGFSTVSVDGNPKIGSSDLILVKYNASGEKQWTRQFGVGGSSTSGKGVTTSTTGAVFVTGQTDGGLDGNTVTGSQDLFLIRYDSSGTRNWTKLLGAASAETTAQGIALDATDSIFLVGHTTGGLGGNSQTGNIDYHLSKFDSSGALKWVKQGGVPGEDVYGQSLACDRSGNIFLVGYATGGLDGNTLIGTNDAFLMKFDSLGEKH